MGEPNGNSKSQRYNQAVAKATGQAVEVAQQGGVLELPSDLGGMVRPYTPQEVAADLADANIEFAPRVLKLEEGMLVTGFLEGRGGDVDMEQVDRAAGTVTIKQVGTWIIRAGNLRASFLTAAQLEAKLPAFVGGIVKIYVGPMKETNKGHRYRDFLVGGPKIGGATRSFAIALPGADDRHHLRADLLPPGTEDLIDAQ